MASRNDAVPSPNRRFPPPWSVDEKEAFRRLRQGRSGAWVFLLRARARSALGPSCSARTRPGALPPTLTRLGCYGCWPVLMTGSRPEASTCSIRFHLARAHWRALRGRHVLAAYGLGSAIENSKDSRSEDHSTLRKCHVWQLASARPYYLRSYPRPSPSRENYPGK